MPRSIFARFIGFLSPLCVLALSLQAQDPKQGGLNQTIKFEGKIAGAQGGVVKVVTEDKKEYLVKLPDDVKNVSYSGTASLPWLSRGLFVRFDAQFDEKGNQQSLVKQLEVFVPDLKVRDPKEEKNNIPGMYASGLAGSDEIFADKDKPKGPKVSGYRVVGQVTGGGKEKIGVAAGNNPLQVEVDPNLVIAVNVPSLDFAMPGDKISVSGFVSPVNAQMVAAERVAVTGAEPLGKKNEKSSKKPKDKAKKPEATKPAPTKKK